MAELTFDDLIPAQAAGPSFDDLIPAAPAAGDGAAAVGRGLINGVPVVGPYLLGGLNRGVAAVRTLSNGTTFPEELKKVEAFGESTAKENPWATTGGELAGGVIGTAPLMAAAPAAFGASAGPIGLRMGAAALSGSALGGADAAVRSGGDLGATEMGALVGGVGGFAAPAIAAGAGKLASGIASKIKPAATVPTVEELKLAGREAYERAAGSGVQITKESMSEASQAIAKLMREAGIDKTIHPKATAAVSRVKQAGKTEPTLQDMELLRRVAKGASGSIEPDEKRLGQTLVGHLDDYMGNLGPNDLISGDPEVAVTALKEARGLWSRAKKAEVIDEATLKAERRAASTGSGGNVDNAMRQNIRAILDNPKRRAGFTADERNLMDLIVRGSKTQNAARLAGKLSPVGNGLMAALGIGVTAANPLMAAVPALGFAAKTVADRSTARNIGLLDVMIRNGGQIPASPLALPAQEATKRLTHGLLGGVLPYASQRR